MAGSEVLFGFDVAGAAVVAVMLDFLAGVFSSVSSSSVFTMIEQDATIAPITINIAIIRAISTFLFSLLKSGISPAYKSGFFSSLLFLSDKCACVFFLLIYTS